MNSNKVSNMSGFDSQKETIVTCIENGGAVWTVGAPIPGEDINKPTTKVVKIVNFLGNIEIFAAPIEGSELDQAKQALHITLWPLSVKATVGILRFDHWKMLLAETEAAAAAEAAEKFEYEDDEDDEDDEDEPVQSTQLAFAQGAPQPVPGFIPQQNAYVPNFAQPSATQPLQIQAPQQPVQSVQQTQPASVQPVIQPVENGVQSTDQSQS